MRIKRQNSPIDRIEVLRSEIAEALSPTHTKDRICGKICRSICPQCGSTDCQCQCSADCPEAGRNLSVEPDEYPIEPGILPLVFEMKRLGLFTPCWSCEGHMGHDGKLWKLPRVWFYSESETHVRLLAGGLKELEFGKKLNTRWQVVVTFSDDDDPETTYSIEPVDLSGGGPPLAKLQQDVATIAGALDSIIASQAAGVRENMDRTDADGH